MNFISSLIISILAVSLTYVFLIDEHFDPHLVKGKKVLITGASQNIGKELALQFSAMGAQVYLTARRKERLQEVAEECEKLSGYKVGYYPADMEEYLDHNADLLENAVKTMGSIDYVVINHVLGNTNPGMWNGSANDFEYLHRSIKINYLSYVHLSTHASKYLTESKGHLVVVSSLAGHTPTIHQAAYGATKAAINSFYDSLRLEMIVQGVKSYSITNCLLGPINTHQNRWSQHQNKLKISGTDMSYTVSQVIKASVLRKSYVFVPNWMWIPSGVKRAFMSDFVDKIQLKIFYGL